MNCQFFFVNSVYSSHCSIHTSQSTRNRSTEKSCIFSITRQGQTHCFVLSSTRFHVGCSINFLLSSQHKWLVICMTSKPEFTFISCRIKNSIYLTILRIRLNKFVVFVCSENHCLNSIWINAQSNLREFIINSNSCIGSNFWKLCLKFWCKIWRFEHFKTF